VSLEAVVGIVLEEAGKQLGGHVELGVVVVSTAGVECYKEEQSLWL